MCNINLLNYQIHSKLVLQQTAFLWKKNITFKQVEVLTHLHGYLVAWIFFVLVISRIILLNPLNKRQCNSTIETEMLPGPITISLVLNGMVCFAGWGFNARLTNRSKHGWNFLMLYLQLLKCTACGLLLEITELMKLLNY